MLTEREIEQFGYGNEAIFVDLEKRIMADIVRRIKKTQKITSTADFQLNRLRQLGYSTEDIKDMLTKALNASDEYVDKLYEQIAEDEYVIDKSIYTELDKPYIKYEDNGLIQNIVAGAKAQTKDEMKNLSQTMGFVLKGDGKTMAYTLSEYYKSKMDQIIADIAVGGFDYNTMLKKAVKEMTNSGIRWIDYSSGWHNRITVAARRSVMTGIAQIAQGVVEYNANQLDAEYFEVSAHEGARPSHAKWQGKVYTKEELTTICGLGTVTGLLGANCYHTYYPFFPGISERAYNDDDLIKWQEEKDREYKGKKISRYEASQIMRKMETNVRAQRAVINLLKEGDAAKEDITLERAKYSVMMHEYKAIAKKFDLKEQKERIYIDGLGRV